MPTDYDKLYREERHVLGQPTQEFVTFFEQYEKQKTDVLDIGCGQGRDALFIARMGYRVVGVDISEAGIQQLQADAVKENLAITGIVADLRDYQAEGTFDVVVVDRTLHMLAAEIHLQVLKRLCAVVREGGYLLIADEKSNLPAMREVFEGDAHGWETVKDTHGFLFMQRV